MSFIITCNAGSSSIKLAKYNAETLEQSDKLQVANKEELLAWYKQQTNIVAVGHRVVHGGDLSPVLVTKPIYEQLKKLEVFVPFHQTLSLSIISAIKKLAPSIPQVACFDTSFHTTIPELEKLLPLPYSYFEDGIRRYGFHGLSYEYITSILPNIAGSQAAGKVIVAHLGNGSSICGMVNLQSRAISIGFQL